MVISAIKDILHTDGCNLTKHSFCFHKVLEKYIKDVA